MAANEGAKSSVKTNESRGEGKDDGTSANASDGRENLAEAGAQLPGPSDQPSSPLSPRSIATQSSSTAPLLKGNILHNDDTSSTLESGQPKSRRLTALSPIVPSAQALPCKDPGRYGVPNNLYRRLRQSKLQRPSRKDRYKHLKAREEIKAGKSACISIFYRDLIKPQ